MGFCIAAIEGGVFSPQTPNLVIIKHKRVKLLHIEADIPKYAKLEGERGRHILLSITAFPQIVRSLWVLPIRLLGFAYRQLYIANFRMNLNHLYNARIPTHA